MVGLGFLVLVFGIETTGGGGKPGMIWLVLIYLLHTIGELCLSPVGLSMITKLSVPRVVGMMMGVWFLASAAANYIASMIAGLTGADGAAADPAEATARILSVYNNVGWLAVAVAVFLLLIAPRYARRTLNFSVVGLVVRG
jgi:POT family proton-dependent oligopeptide transporter